jgi:hypothetical protein
MILLWVASWDFCEQEEEGDYAHKLQGITNDLLVRIRDPTNFQSVSAFYHLPTLSMQGNVNVLGFGSVVECHVQSVLQFGKIILSMCDCGRGNVRQTYENGQIHSQRRTSAVTFTAVTSFGF